MSEKIIYPFIKSDGFARPCKKGCPNCTHCTDVWWDYSNGIYYTECELDGDAPLCEHYQNDGTEPITVEEFNKLKEAEDVRFFSELKCSNCSKNTGECSVCIFEGSELCPKNEKGRFIL